MTTKDIFEELQKRLDANPGKLAGLNAVYQFNISGADAGQYNVAVADGKARVREGVHASPNVTVSMASNDLADLVNGKLDGVQAFMTGKLKVAGDIMLAMRLQSLLQ
jgi:putative sterol carrier protein